MPQVEPEQQKDLLQTGHWLWTIDGKSNKEISAFVFEFKH